MKPGIVEVEFDYDTFKVLYEENKDKIYMKPEDGAGKHNIDTEHIQKWREQIAGLHYPSRNDEIPTYLKFADAYAKSLRYVSFAEFLDTIRKISAEIIELIKNSDHLIFIVDGGAAKSNIWVALLFFGELEKLGLEKYKEKINWMPLDASDNNLPDYVKSNPQKKFGTVYFDDMSYTGTQISGVAPNIIGLDNLKYYVAVPFITERAFALLSDEGIVFFDNTERVASLYEHIKEYYKDEPDTIKKIEMLCYGASPASLKGENHNMFNAYTRGRKAFSCGFLKHGQLPIYFDHKIADYMSVLPDVMSFGIVPRDLEYKTILNMGYKYNPPMKEAGSHMKDCYGEAPPHDETDGVCYKTFYKQIKYTYKGNQIAMSGSAQVAAAGGINMLLQMAKIDTNAATAAKAANAAKGGARKTLRRKFKGKKRLTKIKGRRW
jgi:hypothetical protein